jgi:hypothetical protein
LVGETLASVCTALPQMRSSALTMPTETEGGCSTLAASVRPTAMAVWPIFTSAFGAATGTGRPVASIFRSVSIRVWSVATVRAT